MSRDAEHHPRVDALKTERARARRWGKRAQRALKLITYELNRSVERGERLEVCERDPSRLTLSLALMKVGALWGQWSLTQAPMWPELADTLQALSSHSGEELMSDARPLGGPFFGDRVWVLARVSGLLSDEGALKINELLAFSRDDPRRALDELALFYEGTLDYRCVKTHELKVEPSSHRKRTGAHFTPRSLARELALDAMRDLEQLLEARAESTQLHLERLMNLRICDPSSGAGVFLLEAAERLTALICAQRSVAREALCADERVDQEGEHLERAALSHVVSQCLFGVDINSWSSELARLILWIRCGDLSPEREILSALRAHICTGDALTDRASHEVIKRNTFDLVIGNPPYVSFYGRGSQAKHYPQSYLALIRQEYSEIEGSLILSGRLNLFLSFCALAHDLARRDGAQVSLVLPDSVLTNESYTPLRRALTEGQLLRSVTLYQDSIFLGATVGASVVSWTRRVALEEPLTDERAVRLQVGISQDQASQVWHERHHDLSRRPRCSWYPISTAELSSALVSDESTRALGDIAWVCDGFNTGAAGQRARYLTSGAEPPTATSLASRPCLEGKGITPYKLRADALWIKLPTSIKSLKLSRYNRPKVIYRQTASRPIAAVDTEGLCYLNSAHAIILKHAHGEPALNDELVILHALSAYLNSERCARYYQALSGERRAVFPQIHVSTMRQLRAPYRICDPHDPVTVKLAQYATRLSALSDVEASRDEATSSHEAKPREQVKLLAQIEALVAQLLGER